MSRFVRVTRGAPGVLNENGLENLRFALWENGAEKAHVTGISGAAGHQIFRDLAHEQRGFCEPIPEGRYRQIGMPEWKNGRGNISDWWSAALGPVVIQIYGERAIMWHLDGNVPGSAGCLCPITMEYLLITIDWWEDGTIDFVECDWGLCTLPPRESSIILPGTPTLIHRTKLYRRPNKITVYRDGKAAKSLSAALDYEKNAFKLSLDGSRLRNEDLEFVNLEIGHRA